MSDNKRIAKNTIFLYFRMIFLMIISLYTSRVTLKALGTTDYGVYNVVAGIVTLFTFFNNALTAGVQRFLNYYLGKKDEAGLKKIFAQSFHVYIFMVIFIIILCETVGLALLEFYMSIPQDRMWAARIVYQLSVIATALSILRIPFNAVIIAYEKMNFYAYISIVEGILKLLCAAVLLLIPLDKLIFYALFYLITTVLIYAIYHIYCSLHFEIINFKWYKDRATLKELMAFSGWNVVGTAATVLVKQGNNILVNKYFGVVYNAALGIATQVTNAISQFLYNFQTAFNPHIVKSYAKKDYDILYKFCMRTSKFSFYLMYFVILPFIINMDFVLKLWLEEVPQFTEIFVLLLLVGVIVDAFSGPLWMLVEAEGNIKFYQLVGTVVSFLTFLVIFLAYIMGTPYFIGLIINDIELVIFAIWRVFYLKKRVDFPIIHYMKDVFGRSFIIIIVSITSVRLIHSMIPGEILRFFITCAFSCVILVILYFTIGVTNEERNMIKKFIDKKLFKHN